MSQQVKQSSFLFVIRVNSLVIRVDSLFYYQLDFVTPGISPLFANSLKHILHNPNALINPLLLPHLKHLLTSLVENFGFFFADAICEVLAILIKRINTNHE